MIDARSTATVDAGADPPAAGAVDAILAHDWLVGMRGGERVLERLAQRYGPTDLYLLVDDGRPHAPAIDACQRHVSPLQRIPGGAGCWRRHLLPLMPWAVERLRPRPARLLISTSSAVMKSIRPAPGTVHVCYCHSPARYAWDQADDYAIGSGGRVRRAGLAAIGPRFRRWDRRTADRVDVFVANSRHTADRIRRCWDRASVVVHPPVRTDFFTVDPATEREDWVLVVSALEPYKRTDLVIEAAQRAGVPLRIAGRGSQADALEAAAAAARGRGHDVRLLGRVDDAALRTLYRRAAGLVFPQLEDFGIVPVEAMACGCPVVAFGRGGALDTVTDDTGVLFAEQSPESIAGGLRELLAAPRSAATCRAWAETFSGPRFDAAMDEVVRAAMGD